MNLSIDKYLSSIATNSGFKFSKYSNQTILSTSFAISTSHLEKIELTNKETYGSYLLANRTEEGYFTDENYGYHKHIYHGPDYVLPQFSFFSLTALDILGFRAKDLFFVQELSEDSLLGLLESSMLQNFWATSNQVMFQLYFLAYELKYNLEANKELILRKIDLVFEFLNRKQNKNDGYWGNDKITPSMYHKAYGAAHIYLFYDYFGKEIPLIEKVIDSTLKLHKSNGLIETLEGGACEDYDIIEIYLRCLKQSDYRKDEIFQRLIQMKSTIEASQNKDRGFSYRLKKSNWRDVFRKKDMSSYKYSSWDYMETPLFESDIWATFFRCLSIKTIEHIVFNKNNFNSINLPGWGYIS
ncbi:hypothetical protein [Peijinzhouia sedimentorum]